MVGLYNYVLARPCHETARQTQLSGQPTILIAHRQVHMERVLPGLVAAIAALVSLSLPEACLPLRYNVEDAQFSMALNAVFQSRANAIASLLKPGETNIIRARAACHLVRASLADFHRRYGFRSQPNEAYGRSRWHFRRSSLLRHQKTSPQGVHK